MARTFDWERQFGISLQRLSDGLRHGVRHYGARSRWKHMDRVTPVMFERLLGWFATKPVTL